jgi:hypothetical protein
MDPCFYIGIYKDQLLARKAITSVRTFYPEAPIISISDGIEDKTYESFCLDHSVRYWQGERLKLPQFAGQWTERWFKTCAENSDSDVFIKIDPDTRCFRRASLLDTDVFGRVIGLPNYQVFGPAFGIKRAAAVRIVDSGLLRDFEYTAGRFTYTRFLGKSLRQNETQDLQAVSSQDKILGDIILKLKLTVGVWKEVSLRSYPMPPVLDQDLAFVHPVG